MFVLVSWALMATRSSDAEPRDTTNVERDVGFILLSSVLGIVIGDNTWLQALLLLGPGRVIVVDALKPGLAALFGYLFLKEPITLAMVCGILLSTVGVYLVCANSGDALKALEQEQEQEQEQGQGQGQGLVDTGAEVEQSLVALEGAVTAAATAAAERQVAATVQHRKLTIGYLLAFTNVLLDVVGSVLTKRFGRTFNTFEINSLRFGFATVCMGLVFVGYNMRHWGEGGRPAARGEVLVLESLGQKAEAEADEELNGSPAPAPAPAAAAAPVWYRMPSSLDMTRRSWALVTLGVCFVTFLCPALSNFALFQITIGASCVPVCCVQRPVRPALRILTLTLTAPPPLFRRVPDSDQRGSPVLPAAGALPHRPPHQSVGRVGSRLRHRRCGRSIPGQVKCKRIYSVESCSVRSEVLYKYSLWTFMDTRTHAHTHTQEMMASCAALLPVLVVARDPLSALLQHIGRRCEKGHALLLGRGQDALLAGPCSGGWGGWGPGGGGGGGGGGVD